MQLVLLLMLVVFIPCIMAGWWGGTKSHSCISGNNDWTGTASSQSSCRRLCELFHVRTCLSIDYSASNNKCNLSRQKKSYVPGSWNNNCGTYVYQERHAHGSWTTSQKYCGIHQVQWEGRAESQWACKVRCYQSKNCCSYYYANGSCKLSQYKKSTAVVLPGTILNPNCDWKYQERTDKTCVTTPGNNAWTSTQKGKCLSSPVGRTIKPVSSFKKCKEYCMQEKKFVCISIEYRGIDDTCILNEYKSNDATLVSCSFFWKYSERNNFGTWFIAQPGCIISNNAWVGKARSKQACQIKCSQTTLYDCLSIDYKASIRQCTNTGLWKSSVLTTFKSSCNGYWYYERFIPAL